MERLIRKLSNAENQHVDLYGLMRFFLDTLLKESLLISQIALLLLFLSSNNNYYLSSILS